MPRTPPSRSYEKTVGNFLPGEASVDADNAESHREIEAGALLPN
jgi:hypothetical protein